MKEIPTLITCDIHIGGYPVSKVDQYLRHLLTELDRLEIKASFLFPTEAAQRLKTAVRDLLCQGHEVGCHGLTHRDEFYNCLPAERQKENLRAATRQLEEITQRPVRFFRAPAFKISNVTLAILEELGYEADLSVNSQRLGLLSSDVWNFGWMIAHRTPYHPHARFPYRKGKLKIWEIPLSCFILPFMSNTGFAFGLSFMKAFFRFFYCESGFLVKPIVYLTHPEDHYPWREKPKRPPFKWQDLLPSRDSGFRFRYALYETDPVKITHQNRTLLEYMKSFGKIKFLTVPEYVRWLNGVMQTGNPQQPGADEVGQRPGDGQEKGASVFPFLGRRDQIAGPHEEKHPG